MHRSVGVKGGLRPVSSEATSPDPAPRRPERPIAPPLALVRAWPARQLSASVGFVRALVAILCATLGAAGCQDGSGASSSGPPSSAVPGATTASASAAAPSTVAPAAASNSTDGGTRSAPPRDDWLERRLRQADPRFSHWLARADELRLQILVAQVVPRDGGAPSFEEHGYRVDAEYVYPASAIKTFLAICTLRALRALAERHGVELDASARILRCRLSRPGCEPPEADEDEDRGEGERKKHEKLWVRQEIRKLLLYSDNDSYDRLYDIAGHRELNEDAAALGFSSVRFHHRMNAPASRSKVLRRLMLLPRGGPAVTIPLRKSDFEPQPTPAARLSLGKAHFSDRGRVAEPMSFANKNYASLRDMQRLNLSLLFPASSRAVELGLTAAERALVVEAMTGQLRPVRSAARHKPLLPGVLEVLPAERLRYVGKSGRAYGFHLENAYLEDKQSGRGLLVTAVIYANPNGVLNDDDYDYDETSKPFFRARGRALALTLVGEG